MSNRFAVYRRAVQAWAFAASLLLCCPGLAYARSAQQGVGGSQQEEVALLTLQLQGLLAKYSKRGPAGAGYPAAEMASVAAERTRKILEIIEQDPAAALRYALPERVLSRYPRPLQERLEQWVAVEGRFEMLIEDHENPGDSRAQFYLKQGDRRIGLAIAGGNSAAIPTGAAVIARGPLFTDAESGEETMALASAQLMLAAGGSGDPDTATAPAALAYTLGEQRTAVFLVNFQDRPGDMPWTPAAIHERFFTQISAFFRENSYDQTWLSGDVLGWYTLPIDSTASCNQWGIADAADAIAVANDIDLGQYDRRVYLFPQNTCTWSGVATVGGTGTRAWVNGVPYSQTPAHELGHNLGLLHSHGLNCRGDATATDCVSLTYGDMLDTMGARPGHYNAFQKERLGWMNQGYAPPILTATASGSYGIELLETAGGLPKALKIPGDADPVSGAQRWYYLEFRQAVGEDGFIATDPYLVAGNIGQGVLVRLATEGDGDSSYLLDMTPESTTLSSNFADLYDPALVSGASYTDGAAGLTIATTRTDGQLATVQVDRSAAAPACSHADPALAASPSQSQWVAPGTTVDFVLSLSNRDGSDCPASTFDIVAAAPAGWTAGGQHLALAPGETGSAVVPVTSPGTAADGFYAIAIDAGNSDAPGYGSTTATTYVVSGAAGNAAPTAVPDAAVLAQLEPIVVDVLANDSDPDNDPIQVSELGGAARGTVSVNADGTILYSPGRRFKESDSFTYVVSDGMASASTTVTVSLQAGGGSGGGKGGGKPGR